MAKRMSEFKACFIFSAITLCLGSLLFYGSTITQDSKINYYVWGSIFCLISIALCIAGFCSKREYNEILKNGTVVDAVVRLRTESLDSLQVNLIVSYVLDDKEVTNMLLDSFNRDCPIQIGDTIKVRAYNDKALLVEEDLNEK